MLFRKIRNHGKWLMVVVAVFAMIGLTIYQSVLWQVQASQYQISSDEVVDFMPVNQEGRFMYLSDTDYMDSSRTGYGQILKNTTASGTDITLQYDGETRAFSKGIWAHATSNVDYDLRAYNQTYDYLLVYVGLNKTANSAGNVKFSVFTSSADTINPANASEWGQARAEVSNAPMTSSMDAQFIKIDIRNVNYIRFYASSNGSNNNDHAVYGGLMLVKDGYGKNDSLLPTVAELDTKIEQKFGGIDLAELEKDPDYQVNILRRTLIERASRGTIIDFLHQNAANCEALNWLYNDLEALKQYIHGGKVSALGTYARSLEVLSELYSTYQDDLDDGHALNTTSGKRGDLYQRMLITISLTHAEKIRLWVRDRIIDENGHMVNYEAPDSANVSRPVDRYKVYKRMYLAGKLNTKIFEQLEVEEMRYVMATMMGDDEIEWFHDYLEYKGKGPYSWPMLPYRSAGYWHVGDYAEENQDRLTAEYLLDGHATGKGDYKIVNTPYQPRLWMINYWGGVCWQISNTGQNMMSSFGIPSTTLGQRPDHVAYANYAMNDDGEVVWQLTNNVYGWATTDFVGYDGLYSYRYSNAPMRHMNDWGFFYDQRGYAYKYNGSYLTLAQAAINDYAAYEKAHELVLLAESYQGNLEMQEEIYNQALAVQSLNLDAWLGLIQTYKALDKSDDDYVALAERITEAYRLFPVPMYDMLRHFTAEVEDMGHKTAILLMQTRTLEAALKVTAQDTLQYSTTTAMAKHLLGVVDSEVATFSFDGEKAGEIVLGKQFEGTTPAWDYSLDGGKTWSSGDNHDKWITDHEYKLSADEIKQITAETDIKIHISGVSWEEKNYYTIDITEQDLPKTLYANDWENRVVGVTEIMEWRWDENDTWKSYREQAPQRIGDVSVQVRAGATGTKLPSEPRTFTFTADTEVPERKYLPIAHVLLNGCSSEAPGAGRNGNAAYAIDGNINTRWHSDWGGGDTEKWIEFAFDHNVYLTGMDYIPADGTTSSEYPPAGGSNGRILEAVIETSVDGENWTEVGRATWGDNNTIKSLDLEAESPVRYVRITGAKTRGNFISATMFNFYEDSTRSSHPAAAVGYSTTEVTNGDVVAHMIRPTDDTVITNNGGSDTYVFTENGEFTFEFVTNGVKAWAVARVDWIDKEAPTGRIEFYCTGMDGQSCAREDGKTNHAVDARLVITNEKDEVKVLNNGASGEGLDTRDLSQMAEMSSSQDRDAFVFTFLRNGVFTYRVQDKAGNIGEIEAVVDWIDMAAPKTAIEYSTRNETSDAVVAKLVKVAPDGMEVGGMGADEMTGEDFVPIEKELFDQNGLQYDEDFIVTNNNGSAEYTFTENGEFMFEYRDEAGNKAMAVARVDWIKPKDETPNLPGEPSNPNRPDGNGPVTPVVPPVIPVVPSDSDSNSSNNTVVGEQSGQSGASGGTSNAGSVGGTVVTTVGLPEGAKAQTNKLTMGSALQQQFGKQSEYFSLKFVDEDGNVINDLPESVTLTIDPSKKLKGVYLVKPDGTAEPVEYDVIGDTKIEIKNPKSGNYLFEYEEVKNSQSGAADDANSDGVTEDDSDASGLNPWLIGGGVAIVLILLIGGAMASNRRR